jgi:hypothetical protein
MSEDLTLEELEKLAPAFKRAQELPEKFSAIVTDAAVGEDRRGKKCVFLTLTLDDGSITKIKYSQLHLPELVHALRQLGFSTLKEVIGKKFVFIKRDYRIGYARHIPAMQVKQK